MTGAPRRSGLRALGMVAAAALAIASIWYVGASLAHSAGALRDVLRAARPAPLAAGVALLFCAFSTGCMAWWWVVDRLSPGVIRRPEFWRIWAITNPTRYIPGRVWHVGSLTALLRNAGVAVGVTLASIAIHMWINVMAACVVGLWLLGGMPWSPALKAGIVVAVVAGTVIGTHPRVLGIATRLLSRGAEARPVLRLSWTNGLALIAIHMVVHVAGGFGAWLLLHGTLGLALASAPRVIASHVVSFLVGYVSLVPAGLGVREAAMTMLLTPLSASGQAALGAVVLRVGALVAELLLAGTAALMWRDRPTS